MKAPKTRKRQYPSDRVILMVAIVVILAAVIAAFVFGMAGSTQTTRMATTVTMLDNGTGAITIQGGADLGQVKWIMYSVAGSDFRNVTDTPAVNANATDPFEFGETFYT